MDELPCLAASRPGYASGGAIDVLVGPEMLEVALVGFRFAPGALRDRLVDMAGDGVLGCLAGVEGFWRDPDRRGSGAND